MARKSSKVNTYRGIRYCAACGNPDCVNASDEPYWDACPAESRRERCADCGEYGQATGHMGCQYPQDH